MRRETVDRKREKTNEAGEERGVVRALCFCENEQKKGGFAKGFVNKLRRKSVPPL